MILVTGGTGLLGAYVAAELLSKGRKIRILKRADSSLANLKRIEGEYGFSLNDIEWFDGDVLDISSLQKALDGVEEVYHCAGMVSFSPSGHEQMIRVNGQGTANIVNLALESGVKKFCHVSSVAAL